MQFINKAFFNWKNLKTWENSEKFKISFRLLKTLDNWDNVEMKKNNKNEKNVNFEKIYKK